MGPGRYREVRENQRINSSIIACRNSCMVSSYDNETKRAHEYENQEYQSLSVLPLSIVQLYCIHTYI